MDATPSPPPDVDITYILPMSTSHTSSLCRHHIHPPSADITYILPRPTTHTSSLCRHHILPLSTSQSTSHPPTLQHPSTNTLHTHTHMRLSVHRSSDYADFKASGRALLNGDEGRTTNERRTTNDERRTTFLCVDERTFESFERSKFESLNDFGAERRNGGSPLTAHRGHRGAVVSFVVDPTQLPPRSTFFTRLTDLLTYSLLSPRVSAPTFSTWNDNDDDNDDDDDVSLHEVGVADCQVE